MKESMRFVRNLLPAMIMLTLLIGFFERPVVFHDEIINVYRAQRSIIFDYAARPAFYLLTYIGTFILGDHPLALSFVMLLVSLTGAWLSFLFARRHYGYSAGVAAIAAYCWLGWVYASGISAMAHMLPATLAILAFHQYALTKPEEFGWQERIGLSLLLWAILLSHPTGAAYFISFFAIIAFDLVRAWKSGRINSRTLLLVGASWAFISIAIWLLVEINYKLFSGQTYVGTWLLILGRTSSDVFSAYFQPYHYYFHLFAVRFWILVVALFAALACLIASGSGSRRALADDGGADGSGGAIAIRLAIYSLLALCIVSTQSWKFERVAATFAPFVSLALVCVIFEVLGRVKWRVRFLKPFFSAVLVVGSAHLFAQEVDRVSANLDKVRGKYSSFMEAIRGAGSDRVAYVGSRSGIRLAEVPTSATGRQLQHVGWAPATMAEAQALIRKVKAAGYDHLLIEADGRARKADLLRSKLHELRMQRIASYRKGRYELWSLIPLDLSPSGNGIPSGDGIDGIKIALAGELDVFLRYDRVARRGEKNERQVYFEVLGSELDQVEEAIVAVLKSRGYAIRRGLRDANGIRMALLLRGEPSISMLVRGKNASPPFQHAGASASIYLRQEVN